MARLLSSLDIMCGHESIFTYEGLNGAIERLNGNKDIKISEVSTNKKEDWFDSDRQIAESSYMAAPYIKHPCLSNCKIIHVVRNPLKVLSSTYIDADFLNEKNKIQFFYRRFVYFHMPELMKIKNDLERTVAYYVWWNQLIENACSFRIQVENDIGPKLFDFLEIDQPDDVFDDNKINTWGKRKKDLTLEEIPDGSIKQEFIKKIEQYGYTI